ncbi:MAG: hypothetical protein K8R53_13865, partial [Bacteroidales bacterium]|nr:hypothetical protein [Bacteroidales bacterium]
VLFHTKNGIIYPMLGIGGGGLTLSITDRKKHPVNFDDLLADPARESYLSTANFLLNFSIGSDFFSLSDKESGSWAAGFLAGIKIGYVWNFGMNNWYYGDDKLSDSPNAGISGPYIRITLGGGGVSFE